MLTDSAASASKEQPRPLMFGFGKHTCPGRELAKLEILTFLKAFLVKFDYDIVEGQVSRLEDSSKEHFNVWNIPSFSQSWKVLKQNICVFIALLMANMLDSLKSKPKISQSHPPALTTTTFVETTRRVLVGLLRISEAPYRRTRRRINCGLC